MPAPLPPECARCLRPIGDGWRLTGWAICDRRACVRSASHGLLRGLLPDEPEQLDDRQHAAIAAFDKRMHANRPGPPPWAKTGARR